MDKETEMIRAGIDPRSTDSLNLTWDMTANPVESAAPSKIWKLLIVDDEEEVHTLTRLVLRNFEFEGSGLHLLSSYSGVGARQVLRDNPDIAVVLLDVVMEREDSGLRLVKYIREELGNNMVRIILRTGQPGQAPEHEVVARYDINDYKAKTELTSRKLFTSVTSALRSWRDLRTIDKSRQGLRRVIEAGHALFNWQSGSQFAAGVLDQLVGLAAGEGMNGLVAFRDDGDFIISHGVGKFAPMEGRRVGDVVPGNTGAMVTKAKRHGSDFFFNNSFVSCIRGDYGQDILFLVRGDAGIPHMDRDLVRLFMGNVAMAFHNLNLGHEIIATQKEIIHTLGEVVETRSKETANHVLRVGKMAGLLARQAGLSEEEATILRMAAPMHDVGKVGIPDAVLNKPGPLDADEYDLIKTHTSIGWEILRKSKRRLMRSAAIVAHQHHEHWDGGGYPAGLVGEEIHIFARITALVDVFDAVINRRVYRQAKDLSEVVTILRDGRGTHFDPDLVDVFLAHLTEFTAIVQAHPDQAPLQKADQVRA